MRNIYLLVILIFFSSCSWFENNSGNDYYLWENYQIANLSQSDMNFRFIKNGAPYIVSVKMFEQTEPVFIDQAQSQKDVAIVSDSKLLLKSGCTMLFCESTSCLHHAGYGDSFFNIYRAARNIIGDSVIISCDGQQDSIVSMSNKEIWETWYDEKKFIYYHLWRLE